jgi:hypothetical protein
VLLAYVPLDLTEADSIAQQKNEKEYMLVGHVFSIENGMGLHGCELRRDAQWYWRRQHIQFNYQLIISNIIKLDHLRDRLSTTHVITTGKRINPLIDALSNEHAQATVELRVNQFNTLQSEKDPIIRNSVKVELPMEDNSRTTLPKDQHRTLFACCTGITIGFSGTTKGLQAYTMINSEDLKPLTTR